MRQVLKNSESLKWTDADKALSAQDSRTALESIRGDNAPIEINTVTHLQSLAPARLGTARCSIPETGLLQKPV